MSVELPPCRNLSCCSQVWLVGLSFAREQMALGSPGGIQGIFIHSAQPQGCFRAASAQEAPETPKPTAADGAWADFMELGGARGKEKCSE